MIDIINKILDYTTLTVNWEEVEKIPEFKKLKETPQNPYWHKEGDAFKHTKMVVEEVYKLCPIESSDIFASTGEASIRWRKRFYLVLAALFHDIGKGETTRWDKSIENYRAPYHAPKSEKITRRLLWDIHFPDREIICSLVGNHMKPLYVLEKENPDKEIMKLSMELAPLEWLITLKYADCQGSITEEYDGWREKLEKVTERAKELNCLHTSSDKLFDNTSRYEYFYSNDTKEPIKVNEENYSHFTVFFLIGLPGSGKSTIRNTTFEGLPVVCRDDIRTEIGLKGDKPQGNKEQEEKVTEIQNHRILEYCKNKTSFVIDATNLRKEFRTALREMIHPYNAHVIYYYVEAPTFKDNLQRRKGMIPKEIIEKMRKNFDFPKLVECERLFVYKQGLEWFNEIK